MAKELRWDVARATELNELQDLLYGLSGLNDGSGAIDKLPKLVAQAKKLLKEDLHTPRISFLSFVRELCVIDRQKG